MGTSVGQEKLTAKQEKAILALLAHTTLSEASSACAVGETTLFRWLQIPLFASRYRQARREIWQHSIARLQKATTVAVSTLQEIAENQSASDAARVSASRAILEHSAKSIELEDLSARLTELERLFASQQERKRA